MITVNAIHSLNEEWMAKGDLPVAQDAIHNERHDIGLARQHFEKGDYLCFVNNYNLLSRYSLVAYPTAYHNDNLNQRSLENKILLIDYTQSGDKSQSGSLFGNHFCFALLEWGHEKKRGVPTGKPC